MNRMRRMSPLIIALVTLLPAGAAHATAAELIRDCTLDEVLQGTYTQAEYRAALAKLDADKDEYTNCREVIRNAQLAAAAGVGPARSGPGITATDGSNGSGSSGSNAPTPTASTPGAFGGFSGYPVNPVEDASTSEREAIAAARNSGQAELAAATLPASQTVALGAMGIGLVVMLLLDLRRRIHARRGA